MTDLLKNPIFQDEAKAREWLERRVWPKGPICAHCGATDDDVTKLEGENHRPGLYQCNQCREQFTVTVKTVFERSKIPLTKWLAALFLMTASKKGVSAHQVHRMLGVSYKSTWFMMHRLREAMRSGGLKKRRRTMKTFEFSIIASGLDPNAEGFADRFFVAGCDDATVSLQKGHIILDFARDANSLRDAIISAVEDVKKTSAKVERIEPDPLVSLSDIAARSG